MLQANDAPNHPQDSQNPFTVSNLPNWVPMVSVKIPAPLLAIALVAAPLPQVAQAESLRCNGNITSEGDSRLSVLYKCGQPVLVDTFCAPVFYAPSLAPVPQPFASVVVPCQQVEEWLYDRGPGNLMATVRIKSGVVQSITYGRAPQ